MASIIAGGETASPPSQHVNAQRAVNLAEAELMRIYGKSIKAERPFTAKLENGIWTVTGNHSCQEALPARDFWCHGYHWVSLTREGRIVSVGSQPGRSMSH